MRPAPFPFLSLARQGLAALLLAWRRIGTGGLALLLLPLAGQALSKAEADTLALRAQEAYAAGDYTGALHLFDSVNTAYTSAALLHNIGNCWSKLGDVPRAILHYERALRLAPGAEDTRANLDLVRQQVVDRVHELPAFTLGTTWGRLRGGRDPDQWARRSLWACLAFFAALAAALLVRQRYARNGLLGLAGALFVATLLSVAFAAVRAAEIADDSEAIILAPRVDVRSEPRAGATVLFVLHKGTKVTVLQEREAWSEVKLPNGGVGWMPPATLERI